MIESRKEKMARMDREGREHLTAKAVKSKIASEESANARADRLEVLVIKLKAELASYKSTARQIVRSEVNKEKKKVIKNNKATVTKLTRKNVAKIAAPIRKELENANESVNRINTILRARDIALRENAVLRARIVKLEARNG